MANHTPGPWKARDYRTNGNGNSQSGSIWIDCDAWTSKKPTARLLGGTIAEVYARGTGSDDPAVQEANAKLIAAAPEMLQMLVDLLKPGSVNGGLIEAGRDLLERLGHDVRAEDGTNG